MRNRFVILLAGVLLLAACTLSQHAPAHPESPESPPPRILSETPHNSTPQPLTLFSPQRITKKPFGVFITPEESPVQPERFRGYHTGADFEVQEGEDPHTLIVHAMCKGTVLLAKHVSGYGGVLVQSCMHTGEPITVLYGHIALPSISVQMGDRITQGQAIATLGRGNTSETDNERPHLHLAVHRGKQVELRGYVQLKEELTNWIDPLKIF